MCTVKNEQCEHNFRGNGWNFMAGRFWVGIWTTVILLLIVATDMSALVAMITRFTEECFATLIALLFIVQAFEEIFDVAVHAPLTKDPQKLLDSPCICQMDSSSSFYTNSSVSKQTKDYCMESGGTVSGLQCNFMPDVFLMSFILFFGTFLLIVFLKKMKTSNFFPTKVRVLLSDFSSFLAIIVMTCISHSVGLHMPTLTIPTKIQKGFGYHLDLFVLSLLFVVCSLFGIPFFVAATVLSIVHVQSLRVESETAAPGEKPQFLGIREQRLTAMLSAVLIGLSVFMAQLIRLIPTPVLYGVFLFMGYSSLQGQQLMDRIMLVFIPAKYQADFIYLRVVPMLRVHLYTGIQILSLALLFVIKNIKKTSMLFPLMLIVIVAIRKLLERIFYIKELDALDHRVPTWMQLNGGRKTVLPAWCKRGKKKRRKDAVSDATPNDISNTIPTVEISMEGEAAASDKMDTPDKTPTFDNTGKSFEIPKIEIQVDSGLDSVDTSSDKIDNGIISSKELEHELRRDIPKFNISLDSDDRVDDVIDNVNSAENVFNAENCHDNFNDVFAPTVVDDNVQVKGSDDKVDDVIDKVNSMDSISNAENCNDNNDVIGAHVVVDNNVQEKD